MTDSSIQSVRRKSGEASISGRPITFFQERSDVCIIVNPRAGRGRAIQRMQSLQDRFAARVCIRATREVGHAEELAMQAVNEGFEIVGAAGGDGTVHEVANGILRAGRPDTELVVFPIGSANDYAHSLGLKPEWWMGDVSEVQTRRLDVGLAEAEDGRQRYFVNGMGLGFNGSVTIESQRIGRLQGVALYGLALLRALCFRFVAPAMLIRIDAEEYRGPVLALTVALGRREGNFIMAPAAILDDGLFDYLRAGRLRRWELLRHFPGMVTGRLPTDHPQIQAGRCKAIAIEGETPLPVHLDGEVFSKPEQGTRKLGVNLLSRRLAVKVCPASRPSSFASR